MVRQGYSRAHHTASQKCRSSTLNRRYNGRLGGWETHEQPSLTRSGGVGYLDAAHYWNIGCTCSINFVGIVQHAASWRSAQSNRHRAAFVARGDRSTSANAVVDLARAWPVPCTPLYLKSVLITCTKDPQVKIDPTDWTPRGM